MVKPSHLRLGDPRRLRHGKDLVIDRYCRKTLFCAYPTLHEVMAQSWLVGEEWLVTAKIPDFKASLLLLPP